MARTIDYTNLTEDDLSYLADRQWLVAEGDYQGHKTSAAVEAFRKGEAPAGDEGGDEDQEEDEGVEYKDASVADLRAELESRSLPIDGKKADLIARLEADDAEEPEEDEEEEETES